VVKTGQTKKCCFLGNGGHGGFNNGYNGNQGHQYNSRSSSERPRCYNCQGFGHLAMNCLNKPAAAGAPPK